MFAEHFTELPRPLYGTSQARSSSAVAIHAASAHDSPFPGASPLSRCSHMTRRSLEPAHSHVAPTDHTRPAAPTLHSACSLSTLPSTSSTRCLRCSRSTMRGRPATCSRVPSQSRPLATTSLYGALRVITVLYSIFPRPLFPLFSFSFGCFSAPLPPPPRTPCRGVLCVCPHQMVLGPSCDPTLGLTCAHAFRAFPMPLLTFFGKNLLHPPSFFPVFFLNSRPGSSRC